MVSLLPLLGCSKRAPAEKREGTNWDALIADLEEQIPKLMEETRVPGLSIAIIKDARLAWRRGFGVKDAASKEPVDDDTMFEAGSMSKPVFAYAVMKLCEKGVMNLDTPLTQYTSERFLEGDPRLDLITARHVLSHTSGFQNWRSDQEPLKIHFTPGEKYSYSGEGYSYLQSVVARMTGQAIEPYLKTNLFAPFGMDSSGFVWNDRLAKRMARPHDATGHPMETNKATEAHVARYGAAGELRTTPTDYAKFMLEVIAPKPADAFRLSQNSIKEMLRPHVRVDDGYGGSWALGWRIGQTEKGNIITHGGDNAGFHSTSVASVERSSGFVIMTNGENGTEILQKLVLGDLMVRFL
ncbi:MAG: beta-lactamase family protein [Acidobacteria bacterium]|nr:beta-lactamase family protein [Acidobacteriota bacterium]